MGGVPRKRRPATIRGAPESEGALGPLTGWQTRLTRCHARRGAACAKAAVRAAAGYRPGLPVHAPMKIAKARTKRPKDPIIARA